MGVMALVLLQTVAGGATVLWASGVWGAVRKGFFLLIGVTLTLSAAGAWAIVRAEAGGLPATVLGVLTVLLVLWLVALYVAPGRVAQAVGVLAAALAWYALWPVAELSPHPLATALSELVLGSVFLGSALFGLLLGHWYLVERRLSNAYMIRSAWWFAGGVAAGVGAVVLSARNPAPPVAGFSPVLAVPGFSIMLAGGLVAVCALIAGFVWKLAGEGGRSIQAATGMFYLAVIMAYSAEMSAKFRFF
jgi:hypothetical protein